MNLLVFDTSSDACSVAILKGKTTKGLHQVAPRQHSQLILPMIRELLESSALTLAQLDAIAYGCGPGSFTGIRIASSVAQGLGFAHSKPILTISSLAALAQTALFDHQWARNYVAVDARMGQVYWALYEANQKNHVELRGQEQIINPEKKEIGSFLEDDGFAIGDAWKIYPSELLSALNKKPLGMNDSILPKAEAMVALARAQYESGESVPPMKALPSYLR